MHIFLSADKAIDRKLAANIIPSHLPFIKGQALDVIQKDYPSGEIVRVEISKTQQSWYRENYPELIQNSKLVREGNPGRLQGYEENVFPDMRVTWGTDKNNLGYKNDMDCFRCHGKLQEVKTGRILSSDRNLCHVTRMAGPGKRRLRA